VQALSNPVWQGKIDNLRREASRSKIITRDAKEDQPGCRCGCGTKLLPDRKFLSNEHQSRWMRDGGASGLARAFWDQKG